MMMMKSLNDTPLAIVGMGCRLPGDADSPEKLWRLLLEGRNAWGDVPSDRYTWKSFSHPHQDIQETHNQRGGHFIQQDVAAFDANFFGIPMTEANALDPQQRILLETTYEALESAGIQLDTIKGTDTAVYTATFNHDYETMALKDTFNLPKYHLTGNAPSIVSNRISYLFDLKGPSISLDTACSGGLVAIHQACLSLRSGESSMAIVGGTNLILTPDFMFGMSFMG
jgi:acyl transferase domain-containing protein